MEVGVGVRIAYWATAGMIASVVLSALVVTVRSKDESNSTDFVLRIELKADVFVTSA